MATESAWKPYAQHGELSARDRKALPTHVFAFPNQRKEPLTDTVHVQNALARFDQIQNISDDDRDLAFANLQKAAAYYSVHLKEKSWRNLSKKPHTRSPVQ
jgi:hypothetical protein